MGVAGVVLVACGSQSGSNGAGGSGGIASGVAGNGGSATGGGGSAVDAGGTDAAVPDGGLPPGAACTPGVGTGPLSPNEISCTNDGITFGVPNGDVVYGKTYVLPSPLIPGADNALSFEMSGWGPFNFELWGTNTPGPACTAEELLWWGPFVSGTQCAQFKPSKAFTHLLFVYRQMYSVTPYAFSMPSAKMCPGGTCPLGTTGTGKLSDAPISGPIGNYQINRYTRIALGWEMTFGRSGRTTLSWLGDVKPAGQAQPLSAGVFRMPATDPYGDAWYCIGDGSTLTQIQVSGSFKGVQLALRGVTRLGECGETPGSGSLSATVSNIPQTSNFTTDISGTISSWAGTALVTNQYCSGAFCSFRFRGASQSHFLHLSTMETNLAAGTMGPVPITAATWLVQESTTQPFSMACSSEGTLNSMDSDDSAIIQLAKVTSPKACPGTPITNDRLDLTIDW